MNPIGVLKEVSLVVGTEQLNILVLVNVYPGGVFSTFYFLQAPFTIGVAGTGRFLFIG